MTHKVVTYSPLMIYAPTMKSKDLTKIPCFEEVWKFLRKSTKLRFNPSHPRGVFCITANLLPSCRKDSRNLMPDTTEKQTWWLKFWNLEKWLQGEFLFQTIMLGIHINFSFLGLQGIFRYSLSHLPFTEAACGRPLYNGVIKVVIPSQCTN